MAEAVVALAAALRDCIARHGDRVKDVFKAIDKDGSGNITCKEFSEGVLGLGLPLTKEQFSELDGAPSIHPPHRLPRESLPAGLPQAYTP